MQGQYLGLLELIGLSAIICAVMVIGSWLLGPKKSTPYKMSPYECGVAPEDAPARVPHHGPMPPDQHLERGRIALVAPSVQQLGIARAAVWIGDPMQVSQDRSELFLPHGEDLPETGGLSD